MQKALPGLLIPSMPNKQSMLRRITNSTARVNLSKLFRRVQKSDQDTRSWNPAQLAPFTDLGANQPPAHPEAANILYTDGSAATGLEGQSIELGCTAEPQIFNLQWTLAASQPPTPSLV